MGAQIEEMAMEPTIVSLEATDMDWFHLVRFVETSGTPLWLEAGGEVRGVLLPPVQARRLFGQLMEQNRGEGIPSHERSRQDMPARSGCGSIDRDVQMAQQRGRTRRHRSCLSLMGVRC